MTVCHISPITLHPLTFSPSCARPEGVCLCSRCSGMGPSLSLLHSSLLLQAADAAHKLKQEDKKSILVRTGSTTPGKYQY